MNKLLLVDGSNLLFQMFFGMPSRIVNKKGKAIQGTLGFVGALLKMIKKFSPTHVLVLFDGESQNERKILDENYKANRIDYSLVDESENPFSQLNDIYNAIDYLNIKRYETTTCESDDLIASYAIKLKGQSEIVISSFDSDFFQLIDDNVTIFRYRGENSVTCDRQFLFDKFAILPERYADFKSLTGDTSDNIKGAHGVGPKRASALINEFGTLNNLLENCEKIAQKSVKESILESKERLKNNYALIKLTDCCELPFSFEQLRVENVNSTTREVLTAIDLY